MSAATVGGGVSQMLTIAYGGGMGGQEPLILADVICEQPLITGRSFLCATFVTMFVEEYCSDC